MKSWFLEHFFLKQLTAKGFGSADQEVRDIGAVEYRDEVMDRLRMRIIYLKASVKDSVDNDKGEEGD